MGAKVSRTYINPQHHGRRVPAEYIGSRRVPPHRPPAPDLARPRLPVDSPLTRGFTDQMERDLRRLRANKEFVSNLRRSPRRSFSYLRDRWGIAKPCSVEGKTPLAYPASGGAWEELPFPTVQLWRLAWTHVTVGGVADRLCTGRVRAG